MPFGRAFGRHLLPADSLNDPICHGRERRFRSTARVGSQHLRHLRLAVAGAMGAMDAVAGVAGVAVYG
jgi:hypothetical protein